MDYVPGNDAQDVPDPYGGDMGFEHVLDLVEAGCDERSSNGPHHEKYSRLLPLSHLDGVCVFWLSRN